MAEVDHYDLQRLEDELKREIDAVRRQVDDLMYRLEGYIDGLWRQVQALGRDVAEQGVALTSDTGELRGELEAHIVDEGHDGPGEPLSQVELVTHTCPGCGQVAALCYGDREDCVRRRNDDEV